jgi:hypothetical protein
MVHPHLRSKGEQFTEAQIQYDKGVKEKSLEGRSGLLSFD